MSRRRRAVKRKVVADPKYGSTLVARLVSILMLEGKKSIAQKVVYGAMDNLGEKNPSSSPLDLLQRAVDNAKPRLEVKPRRVGGATYQVPMEVPAERQQALAIRWIVKFANSRKGVPMSEAWPTKSWMRIKGKVPQSVVGMRYIKWHRPIRPLLIFAGKARFFSIPVWFVQHSGFFCSLFNSNL